VEGGLRDLTVGIGQITDLDMRPNSLNRWSGGIVTDSPEIRSRGIRHTTRRVAAAGFLYFTVVALTAFRDLFLRPQPAPRALDDEHSLARALQIRWNPSPSPTGRRSPGSAAGAWPLESVSVQTTYGRESDYLTLLFTSIVIHITRQPRAPETDLSVGDIFASWPNVPGSPAPAAARSAISLHCRASRQPNLEGS